VSNISKKYDLMNRDEFISAYDKYNAPDPVTGRKASSTIDNGGNTDWQDAVTRQAYSTQYGLSYGAGDKSGSYLFSAGYLNQEGIVKNSGLKRFTLRFNGDKKFMDDKLVVTTSFTIAQTHDDQVPITVNSGFEGDLWGNALKQAPSNPIYLATDFIDPVTGLTRTKADASGYFQLANTEPNPVAMLNLSRLYNDGLRTLGSIGAEYEIVKGLKFKTVYGLDAQVNQRRQAYSKLLNVTGIYNVGQAYFLDNTQYNNLWENYFT